MTTRALSFGPAAADYERFRTGYPEELVDHVLDYARQPTRTALEIGAGTGKATRAFARRGITITATEPDAAMLAELRRHVPADVITVQASLEDLTGSTTYDLVFAAASLHWTDPGTRWSRVAGLLEPGAVFASFGGPMSLADPDVEESLRAVRAPDGDVPRLGPDGPPGAMRWPGTELVETGMFTDVQQSVFERRTTMSARGYVAHLSTLSAYLVLPAAERQRVLDDILEVLPRRLDVVADLVVHLARRR